MRCVTGGRRRPCRQIRTAFDQLFGQPGHPRPHAPSWIDAYRKRRPTPEGRRQQGPVEIRSRAPHASPSPTRSSRRPSRRSRDTRARATPPASSCSPPASARRGSAPSTRTARSSAASCSSRIARRSSKQSRDTFRRIRPDARLGLYMGQERRGRRRRPLRVDPDPRPRRPTSSASARDAFDYIVVDEFHHAAARPTGA